MTHIGRVVSAVLVCSVFLIRPALSAVESEGGGNVPPDMSQDTSPTPSEYSIPPVNPKSLKNADHHPWTNQTVKNLRGETLGTIEHVMVDTVSGRDTYAMLKLSDKMQPMPVPFNYIKESESGLVMNASKEQLQRGGPNLGGQGKSQDFEHHGSEPLKPNLRQGGS